MTKTRKRRKPEQIVKALAEGEATLAAGRTSAEVYQKLGVAESTWMRWKKQFSRMKSAEAKRGCNRPQGLSRPCRRNPRPPTWPAKTRLSRRS